ncbi:hypothetical protein Dret_2364 [Desulfohalobium retbaense DSM 5692]|uniref:Uncharacterized protein n=1 Tax=Desulfohalobium retbaense (strain ATCC 49708 / DSM 5692 / JCM 16813 / HR100) TaxID=485915 RepID=C8X5F0_DESRD|nr:hypothetical protein Dret_2364 [Desulfohalobium retbaense DSM 5692]
MPPAPVCRPLPFAARSRLPPAPVCRPLPFAARSRWSLDRRDESHLPRRTVAAVKGRLVHTRFTIRDAGFVGAGQSFVRRLCWTALMVGTRSNRQHWPLLPSPWERRIAHGMHGRTRNKEARGVLILISADRGTMRELRYWPLLPSPLARGREPGNRVVAAFKCHLPRTSTAVRLSVE